MIETLDGEIHLFSKIYSILQVSGEIPSITLDARSMRSTSGPIGPEKRVNLFPSNELACKFIP